MRVCEFSGNQPITDHVIIFPGQGIQALGMGSEVCDTSAKTKAVWDCASDISGIDVRKLCAKGPMTRLTKTHFQQLAVTTVNIAMFEALKAQHPLEQVAFAGHSAGEYSALYAAGAFDLNTLFKAIFTRGTLMQALAEQEKGVMHVVKNRDYQALQRVIEQEGLEASVKIANDNSPRQQVISGNSDAVRNLVNHLHSEGVELIKLPVSGAWHSHMMSDGVEPLRAALAALPIKMPAYPIYMNLAAAPVYERAKIVDNLSLHLTHRVRWRETMEALYHDGYRQFLEIGSKRVLGHMLTQHYPMSESLSVSHFSDWYSLSEHAVNMSDG